MWKQNTFLHETNIRTSWEQEIFYSKLYPPNTTVEWVDTDKPEDAIYEKDIKYTFNEYGFRSDSFNEKSDINILTCGCSHTVGVGVDQHEAWPFVLKKYVEEYTNKTVSVWNLATSGASPDYVVRSVYKTINVLKPTFVCVFWPPTVRIEVPDQTNKVKQSFIRNTDFPKKFINDDWLGYYLQMKNFILLDNLCTVNNATFISNTVNKSLTKTDIDNHYFPADSNGRDGMHPGLEWHKRSASYYFKYIKENL